MDTYEKKYKEALERAKKFKSPYCQATVEQIFPELKESEDERIRKDLIEFVNQYGDKFYGTIAKASAIAWLEKQSEPQPYKGNADTMRKNLIKTFKTVGSKHWGGFDVRDIIHFLESKDAIELEKQGEKKPHWKPTEEQMNELEKLIVWADELYDENSIRTIESLYNDIKKL